MRNIPVRVIHKFAPFLLLGIVFSVFSINIQLMLDDRSQILNASALKLQSHLSLLAEHSSSVFNAIDVSLIALTEQISVNDLNNMHHADLRKLIKKTAIHMAQVSNLYIIDATGTTRFIMHPGRSPVFTRKTGTYFAAHKNNHEEFHIENIERQDSQQHYLIISRRISDAKGRFAGIALATISPEAFYLHQQINEQDGIDAIIFMDHQNTVMTAWPKKIIPSGSNKKELRNYPYFQDASQNQLFKGGLQVKQDEKSITAFYQLRNFPIRIAIAYDTQQLLAPWYERRNTTIIFTGSLALLALCSMFLSLRQRHMQRLAETARNQSEKHYRTLAENFPEGVIILFDTQEKITIADGLALAATGLSKKDIEGKHPKEFLPKLTAQILVSHHQFVLNGKRTTFTLPLYNNIFQAHSLPLHDDEGKVEAGMTVLTDITSRQQYEAALRNAKEAAEMANALKGQFVANMSHELRTPISGIMGITDVALSGEPPATWRRYFELINHVSTGLLGVINDVLDFSRIEANKMILEIKPFSIREMLNQTMTPLRLKAGQKNLLFSHHVADTVPEWVKGDAGRIRQVLVNLVDNAIKFTQKGEISVAILEEKTTTHTTSATLHFRITDTGCGIPEESQENLFDSFFQIDGSLSRQHGGSGLGLAICKRLVSLMGGELYVQSTVGKGSIFSFTITLPICDSPALSATTFSEEKKYAQPLRILLAEDNDLNQEFLTYFLEKQGHSVSVANNGKEALKTLKTSSPDLVIMDVQMPELNGLEATKIIRASAKPWAGIPIVALTAHAMSGDKERFLGAGMDAFVGKPVDKKELFAALDFAQEAAANRGWHSLPPSLFKA